MVKIIAFLIIVASSAKIGFDLSERYSNRTRELKAFINILEKVKNEISFSNCIISDALARAAEVRVKSISNMIKHISASVKERNICLTDAFDAYIQKNTDISLNKNDMDEIRNFFAVFGSGDREDEISNINSCIHNMNLFLQSSIEDEKRYVKLFRTSGLLAGFLIAIILA